MSAVALQDDRVAVKQGAGIDLVYVQSWLNKEAAETELARRGWAASAQARQALDAAGISWRLMSLLVGRSPGDCPPGRGAQQPRHCHGLARAEGCRIRVARVGGLQGRASGQIIRPVGALMRTPVQNP